MSRAADPVETPPLPTPADDPGSSAPAPPPPPRLTPLALILCVLVVLIVHLQPLLRQWTAPTSVDPGAERRSMPPPSGSPSPPRAVHAP